MSSPNGVLSRFSSSRSSGARPSSSSRTELDRISRSRRREASSSGAERTSSSSCLIIVPIRMTLAGCSTMAPDALLRPCRRRRPRTGPRHAGHAERAPVGADDHHVLLAAPSSPLFVPGWVMPPSCPTSPESCSAHCLLHLWISALLRRGVDPSDARRLLHALVTAREPPAAACRPRRRPPAAGARRRPGSSGTVACTTGRTRPSAIIGHTCSRTPATIGALAVRIRPPAVRAGSSR